MHLRSLSDLDTPLLIPSPEAMEALGAALVPHLPIDHVLALSGTLGTGKTTLTRGIARGLNIRQTLHSPTYTIYTIYSGARQLIHMDAYRLEKPGDCEALMLEEFMISPWLWVVEWPEKIGAELPADHTHLSLAIVEGTHTVTRLNGKS